MLANVFQGGLAAVIAALLTWLVIAFFRSIDAADESSDSDAASSVQATLLGNVNIKALTGTEKLNEYIRHTSRRLIVAIVLTVPVLLAALTVRFAPGILPPWVESPWLQAVLITPAMFYCGSSVLNEGREMLKNHIPGRALLITLSALASYIYSLAFCIAGNQLPDDSHSYFEVTGIIICLSLLVDLLQAGAIRFRFFVPHAEPKLGSNEADKLKRITGFIRISVIASFCAAIWCFAVLLVIGPQPRLANAVIITIGLLLIAAILLSAYAIWKLAREPHSLSE